MRRFAARGAVASSRTRSTRESVTSRSKATVAYAVSSSPLTCVRPGCRPRRRPGRRRCGPARGTSPSRPRCRWPCRPSAARRHGRSCRRRCRRLAATGPSLGRSRCPARPSCCRRRCRPRRPRRRVRAAGRPRPVQRRAGAGAGDTSGERGHRRAIPEVRHASGPSIPAHAHARSSGLSRRWPSADTCVSCDRSRTRPCSETVDGGEGWSRCAVRVPCAGWSPWCSRGDRTSSWAFLTQHE